MLNSTAAVVENPMLSTAPPAPPGPGRTDADHAFAKALDEAAARQRDAAGDPAEAPVRQGPRTRPDAASQGRTSAAERRSVPGAELRKTEPTDSLATTSVDAGELVSDEAMPLRLSSSDDAAQPAPDKPELMPPDLAAWAPSLPLPRPAGAAANAGTAGARTQALPAAAGATPITPSLATADGPDAAAGAERNLGATTAALTNPPASASARQADSRGPRLVMAGLGDAAALRTGAEADVEAVVPLPPAQRTGLEAGAAAASLPGPWAPAQNPLAQAGAPLQDELQAPVGSSDFAPALGSRLIVMVRDGIDHAQLQLNPAEMGPIEVRISLDGSQAQVDFSAAHASTRQALQDALPALAGALRDQGLTLAGGGVFDQTREQRGDTRQDGTRSPSGRPGAGGDAGMSAAAVAHAPRARGVVDLYA